QAVAAASATLNVCSNLPLNVCSRCITLLPMTYATPAPDEAPSTLFINGSWEPAASGAVRHIHNPADGELAATVSEAGREDAERAIAAARAAFDSGVWSDVPAP